MYDYIIIIITIILTLLVAVAATEVLHHAERAVHARPQRPRQEDHGDRVHARGGEGKPL